MAVREKFRENKKCLVAILGVVAILLLSTFLYVEITKPDTSITGDIFPLEETGTPVDRVKMKIEGFNPDIMFNEDIPLFLANGPSFNILVNITWNITEDVEIIDIKGRLTDVGEGYDIAIYRIQNGTNWTRIIVDVNIKDREHQGMLAGIIIRSYFEDDTYDTEFMLFYAAINLRT